MSESLEARVSRDSTDMYIASKPVPVTFNRQTWVSDSVGGRIPGPVTTFPAMMVAMDASGDRQLPVRRSVDGIELQPEYLLTARHNSDVLRGDWFIKDGIKYEVVFVHPDRSHQTLIEVAYRG